MFGNGTLESLEMDFGNRTLEMGLWKVWKWDLEMGFGNGIWKWDLEMGLWKWDFSPIK